MNVDFSARAVAKWARTKPAGETYDFLSLNCALMQYLKAGGLGEEGSILLYSNFHFEVETIAHKARSFGELAQQLEALE